MSLLRLSLKSLREKTLVWLATGLGGFVAAGVAGLMGLAASRSNEALPEFAPGAPIEAAQWRIVPLRAWIDGTAPDGRAVMDGQKALVVEIDITNRTGATSNDFRGVLTLDPPLAADPPDFMLLRDRDILWELHPDLSERVAIVWSLPQDTVVPEALGLVVHAKDYKKRDNLYGFSGWYNEHPIGTVSLPLGPDEMPDRT